MFRDGHAISKNGNTIAIRPKKMAERKREITQQIGSIKFFLKHATNLNTTNAMVAKQQHKLHKLERELAEMEGKTCTHKFIKTYKKVSKDKIRAYTMKTIEELKAKNMDMICAEDIAYDLRCKTHFVKQVFQQLNVEGILSQPRHWIPHDSSRDPWCGGGYSGWMADIYYINREEEEDDE